MVALEYCLQNVEPKPDNLKNANNRMIWCNRVQSIRPIIQVTKSLILTPLEQQGMHGNNESGFNGQLSTMKSAHILQACRCVFMLFILAVIFL